MVLFQKLAQKKREVFSEFFKSSPNLPPLRTPIALTQKLWQNTSHLQLSRLTNLQSTIGGMTASFAPTWRPVSQQLLTAVRF